MKATESTTNKVEPLSKKIRDKLFFLFHNLLVFKDIPPNLGALLILLQLVQSIVLTFNGNNPYLKTYFFADIVDKIDRIQLYPIVSRDFGVEARIVMNIILLFFILGISASLVVLANQKDYTKNVRIQYLAFLLGYFYEILTKLLFVPIFGTFIVTLQCSDSIVTCFSIKHIVLLVSSILGMILVLIIAYIIDAFFFDFSFKSKDSLAHAPVQDFVLGFIYKTFAVILSVGIFDLEYSSIIALYHVLFNLLFLYNNIKKVTYFNIKVHVCYCIQSATLVWTNGAFIASNLINFTLLQDNTIIIILVGSYFFVNFSINVRQKAQASLLAKEGSELESDILLDAKVRLFFELSKSIQNDSQADLLLSSLMKIHMDHCNDTRCPCKMRSSLYDPKREVQSNLKLNAHKDQTFIKHFIYYILKTGTVKFFTSELMFLDSIFFLFEAMRNYPQAYHLIHLYEKKNLSNNPRIVMQFLIYRLYAKMQDHINSKNEKETTSILAYEKIMEFDEELGSLKTMIFSQIEHYINVWEMIDSEFPDLNILNKLLEKTYNHHQKVMKQYEKTVKVNDQSLELKVVMDIYAQSISYDEELGQKVGKDIETRIPMDHHSDNFNFSRDMDLWNIFDPNCYTIEIANQMERLGQIVNFSKNTLGLVGFQDQELRFQNIKILMPRTIAVHHDRVLKDFFQNGKDTSLRLPQHNFCINNKGYCFSVHMILKTIPMLGHYRLLGLFRKLNQYDYLITDEKGVFDSFGEKLGQLLDLTPQQAQSAKLNLALIAPKVIKYYHYYLVKKVEQIDDEAATKPKSFYIFVPNNWRSFLQRWQEKRRGKGAMSLPSISSGMQDHDEINDIDEYYSNMLDYIRNDLRRNFKKAIKVKAIIEHMTMRNGEIKMKSLKIISYKEKDPSMVPMEKIKKQEELVPILARKIRKILEQRRIDLVHQLELAKKGDDEEVEEESEQGKDKDKKDAGKDGKTPKAAGVWGKLLDNTRFKAKKSEKSLDTLMHQDSKMSDPSKSEQQEDRDGAGTLGNVSQGSRSEVNSTTTIRQGETDRTYQKKPSILKKKSLKENDKTLEKKNSVLDRFKKRVKIFQDKNKKAPAGGGNDTDGENTPTASPSSGKKKKDRKEEFDRTQAYVSLLTEESSFYDMYDIAENGHLVSEKSEAVTNKDRKEVLKGLADQGNKEAKEMLEKKNIGPSSVASTASSYSGKEFALKIKNLLRTKHVPVSLRISNTSEILLTLTVLVLTQVLSALTRNYVGDWVSSIATTNTPNLYEVYIYKVADSYLTHELRAEGFLDTAVYDTAWEVKDRTERQWAYDNIRDLYFKQVSNTLDYTELLPLYLEKSTYNILSKGAAATQRMTFQTYLGFIMNSINETLYYENAKYSDVENDEYLYMLNNNFFINVNFLDTEKAELLVRIQDTLDSSKTLVIVDLATGVGIIMGSLLIILPMFLQHNLHLEEVLVLFTNISKRDSDFFYKHYRAIRLTWNGNMDDYQRLQKEVAEEAKIEAINKKMSKLNVNSKSRPFLRLKSNYQKFTMIISTSILVFTALAVVKMVVIRSGLNDIKKYADEFTVLSEEASCVFKILHNYKFLLSEVVKGNTPTDAQLSQFKGRMSELTRSIDYSLPIKDQPGMGISDENTQQLQDILIGDLCSLVDNSEEADCRSNFNGALDKGYLAIRYDLYAFVNNYYTRFNQVKTSSPAALQQLSIDLLNDEDLKDFLSTWTFIQDLVFKWLNTSYVDIVDKKDSIISLFNAFLAILSVCLLMNLVTWRYSYLQLISTLHRFHKYFEVLPIELIRDNRSIRSYFERYFKMKQRYG